VFLLLCLLIACLSSSCSLDPGKDPYDPPTLYYPAEQYWITEVLEVSPGAGQHANNSEYALIGANYNKVLGAPDGSGSSSGSAGSVISLHGPGATITVRFDPPIENHPDNIGGYDFVVFGNAYWIGGDPSGTHWQEPATIEVMKDENGNGDPDDTWYLIPGSDLGASFPVTTDTVESRREGTLGAENYYPNKIDWAAGESHSEWYPDDPVFPGFPDTISHTFYPINASKAGTTTERIWGYLDVTPTLKLGDMSGADGAGDNSLSDPEDYPPSEYPNMKAEYFYTTPDTHGDLFIDAGSGGGDAIDIAWAVDPSTGVQANLDHIDFVRLTNCTKKVEGGLGDTDAELDAIARVRRQ